MIWHALLWTMKIESKGKIKTKQNNGHSIVYERRKVNERTRFIQFSMYIKLQKKIYFSME